MKSIGKLRDRLQNSRPIKPRPKSNKPPAFALQLGGAYTFPTMQGKSFTPWFSSWEKAEFHPDGYGALIVLRQGRVFDWIPYSAIAPLDVSIDQKAISKDILNSRLSVDWCGDPRMDKKSDIKRMQLTLIDKFELSLEKINELKICSTTPQEACINGWNISSIAFNKAYNNEGLIEHWKHK